MIEHFDVPVDRIDHAMACLPDYWRPLMMAVREGCGLMIVPQGRDPFTLPEDMTRPIIVLIGDDLNEARGPCGFHRPSLRKMLDRTVAAVVVSSEGHTTPYAIAASSALVHPVLGDGTTNVSMLVETRPTMEREWTNFIQRKRPTIPVVLSTVKPGE